MPIIPGLADELERAALFLESSHFNYSGPSNQFPRAVNLLRAKAKQLREPKGQPKGKAKTVKAWVGKRRSKGNEIRIKVDRIE